MDALIERLGGPRAVAQQLGVTRNAVTNWRARGKVPDAQAWRLLLAAIRRGLEPRDVVAELDPSIDGASR